MGAIGADAEAEALWEDSHFKKLASPSVEAEEFERLLTEHVAGYTQRKRLVDALKAFVAKLEAIESKVVYMKAVGKAKTCSDEEMRLYETHAVPNLKDKVQKLNASIQASLDEGRVTADEKPAVLENLSARLAKAKTDGKEKLQEKMERLIAAVSKATPVAVPVPDIKDLLALHTTLKGLAKYMQHEREETQDALKKLEASSRMWFESEEEFQKRLEGALATQAAIEEEERRIAMLRAEEERRLALQQKEEQKWLAVQQKIEQKRAEAKSLPQNNARESKLPKEKKKVIRLDNKGLFSEPIDEVPAEEEPPTWAGKLGLEEYEEPDWNTPEEEGEAQEVEVKEEVLQPKAKEIPAHVTVTGSMGDVHSPYVAASYRHWPSEWGVEQDIAEEIPPPKPVEKEPAPQPKKAAQQKPAKAPPKPSVWGASKVPAEDEAPEPSEDGSAAPQPAVAVPSLAASLGPSLADAAKEAAPAAAKKAAAPQPKKKEKKKFSKVSLGDLGFEYSDAGK